MRNRSENRGSLLVLALLGALSGAGCQDLIVDNTMDADRERATANPEDVEAFIGGAFFPPFFEAIHDDVQVIAAWLTAASDMTATMAGQSTLLQYQELVEPRVPHDNGAVLSLGNGPQGPRDFWAGVTRAASVAYDGLQLIDEGMVILDNGVDVTPRAEPFAEVTGGGPRGQLRLVVQGTGRPPEGSPVAAGPAALREPTLSTLAEYPEAVAAAVGALEDATALAEANPAVVP